MAKKKIYKSKTGRKYKSKKARSKAGCYYGKSHKRKK